MRKRKSLLFAAIVFFAGFAYAQKPPMNFTRLTIDEGLSQNTVFSILQDKRGFIWIGTGDGLNRYDGYEFLTYKQTQGDPESISHSQVNTLYEDNGGKLWIGTAEGLNLYDRDTERFERLPVSRGEDPASHGFVTAVLRDSYENFWVGTLDGLNLFNPRDSSFSRTGQPGDRAYVLLEDRDKTVWAGAGNTLRRIDPVTKKDLPLPAAIEDHPRWGKSYVRALCQDRRGNYWIGTEQEGVFYYDAAANRCINYRQKDGLPSNMVRCILTLSSGEVWIGTREGLSIFNPDTGGFWNYTYDKNDPASLGHNSVRCFLKDDAGSVWIGTFSGGVALMQPGNNNFSVMTERTGDDSGLSHRVVSSIGEDRDGKLWIGTEGGGLNAVVRRTGEYQHYLIDETPGSQRNNIKAMRMNEDGKLWLGTLDGLYLFDPFSGSFRDYLGENHWHIYALARDTGGLWIGTFGRGLNYLDKHGRLHTYTPHPGHQDSLSADNITALLNDGDKGLWIGTERGGLNYFDKESQRFTRFTATSEDSESISSNSILSVYEDAENRLWIGTRGGGLNVYDRERKKFFVIDETTGLGNNVVHAIQEDDSGHLWVSTNKGLSKIVFNPSFPAGGIFSASNTHITHYTSTEGLQSNQFTTGVLKSSDGELFFGGINGVTRFFPDQMERNTHKPRVVLTDFLIRNRPVSFRSEGTPLHKSMTETSEITLRHDQAFFTIGFAALNFIHPEKNRYAYKLEGFRGDDDWQHVGGQRTATYTNLNAGTYLFKVKAANNDGVWGDEAAGIRIKVLPPPWKTWWAYTIYAIVICSLLYAFYYYSHKTAGLENKLVFEQRSRDFFINISHEIKTPLTLILAPVEKLIRMNAGNNKVLHQLMLMQRNGERLAQLTNQLLDFRRFESGGMKLQAAEGDIVRFVKEVLTAFQIYASYRRTSLLFSAPEGGVRLWFDRDKLEKVLYNLLSNAFKFTPEGGRILVTVRRPEGTEQAHIDVEDNGSGIAPGELPRIFEPFHQAEQSGLGGTGIGLAFSKGLVELHRGQISVVSRPAAPAGGSADRSGGQARPGTGGYTRFTVKLPLGKDHLSDDELIPGFRDSEQLASYHDPALLTVSSGVNLRQSVLKETGKDKLIMLIVEDNPELLELLASHFSADFNVELAADGSSGWKKMISCLPDIVISDVMMPGLSGTALCSKLKSDARTSHIPVILLTARTPLIFKIEGLETGADDYITKPFSLHLLEARVWNILDTRRKLRERYSREVTLQPANVGITSADEEFLKKAMQCIEENIAEPGLSVEKLGKATGMTRVTLYRKIKALTGQTPVEFIRNVRLKRAAQLLTQHKFYVNEVAYMTGFTDVDYFRKCFKDLFGQTPKAYAGFQEEGQQPL